MALKAIIHKAHIQVSDMDRQVYGDHSVTIARHPSETDERMLMRLLAFALNAPSDVGDAPLEFAKDMWEPDEPSLWQKDPTGRILRWIEVGQPDEKRILRVSARVERMTIYSFGSGTVVWWKGLESRLTRVRNVDVWQVPMEESRALGGLSERSMQIQVTVQDGSIWVGEGSRSVEVTPVRLFGGRD